MADSSDSWASGSGWDAPANPDPWGTDTSVGASASGNEFGFAPGNSDSSSSPLPEFPTGKYTPNTQHIPSTPFDNSLAVPLPTTSQNDEQPGSGGNDGTAPDLTFTDSDIDFVYEPRDEHLCAMALNDRTFGLTTQLTLSGTSTSKSPITKVIPCITTSFRSFLQVSVKASRRYDTPGTSPIQRVNPFGHRSHSISFDVWASHFQHLQITELTTLNLPECFKTHDPEWAKHIAGKILLSFSTNSSSLALTGGDIPPMENASLQTQMEDYATHLVKCKQSGDFVHFHVVLDAADIEIWKQFVKKVEQDKNHDPILDWIKDSPNARSLAVGNLFNTYDSPPMDISGLILRSLPRFQDTIQMAVMNAYAAKEVNVYNKVKAQAINDHAFSTTLTAIPSSCKAKCSPFDNDLPKSYYGIIQYRGTPLEKPNTGDRMRITFPSFELKEVTAYTGDHPKRVSTEGTSYSDFYAHDGSLVIKYDDEQPSDQAEGVDMAEHQRAQDPNADYIEAEQIKNLKTMTAIVVSTGKSLPAGYFEVVLHRGIDTRFLGGKGHERRVDTDIPSHDIVAKSKDEFMAALASAPKHEVKIAITFSEQYFKDTIRCFDLFCRQDESLSNSNTRAHLAKYFVGFERELEFPVINFFDTYAPANWLRRLGSLTANQRESFHNALQRVHHGYVPIHGVVASTKTHLSVFVGALAAAKSTACKSILISETNLGANSLALDAENALNAQGVKDALVIRLGNSEQERTKFTSGFIPPFLLPVMDEIDIDNNVSTFTAAAFLSETGHQAVALRERGDPRFRGCANLHLFEAMTRNFNAHKATNPNYKSLGRLLKDILNNPEDESIDLKRFKELVKGLMIDTLKSATMVSMTSAQALRFTIHTTLEDCTFLIADESCKRPQIVTMALCGAYNMKIFIENGDTHQPGVFDPYMHEKKYWPPFKNFLRETTLERSMKCHVENPMVLNQQLRLYTPALVQHVSERHYHDTMIDAHANGPFPAEVSFVKRFFNEHFNVNTNFVMIEVANSRHEIEDGGTSVYNDGHVLIVAEIAKKLQRALREKNLGFDQSKFRIAHVSSYKAQSEKVQVAFDDLKDERFTSMTLAVAQGETRELVILELPTSQKVNDFNGDAKSILVSQTRHRYGLVVVKSIDSTDHLKYSVNSEHDLLRVQHVKHWFALKSRFKAFNAIFQQDVPKVLQCNKCQKLGHQRSACTEQTDLSKHCYNCSKPGHDAKDCTEPKPKPSERVARGIDPKTKDEEGKNRNDKTCSVCDSDTHLAGEIPTCHQCKTCGDHEYRDCPEHQCFKCQRHGHLADRCPNLIVCKRCGGEHSTAMCKLPTTLGSSSTYRTVGFSLFDTKPTAGIDVDEQFEKDTQKAITISLETIVFDALDDQQFEIATDYAIHLSKQIQRMSGHKGRLAKAKREGNTARVQALYDSAAKKGEARHEQLKKEVALMSANDIKPLNGDLMEESITWVFKPSPDATTFTAAFTLPALTKHEKVDFANAKNLDVVIQISETAFVRGFKWLDNKNILRVTYIKKGIPVRFCPDGHLKVPALKNVLFDVNDFTDQTILVKAPLEAIDSGAEAGVFDQSSEWGVTDGAVIANVLSDEEKRLWQAWLDVQYPRFKAI